MSAVVSDSSPLNYLALLSDFELLREIFGMLFIPPAVFREVAESATGLPVQAAVSAALGQWISVTAAPDPGYVQVLMSEYRLDLGESEAILVAEDLHTALLMDEQRGVRCARMRGITVIRTPLIYADAKILGLVGSVREKLDQLRGKGFHLADRHYEQVLREVGEM